MENMKWKFSTQGPGKPEADATRLLAAVHQHAQCPSFKMCKGATGTAHVTDPWADPKKSLLALVSSKGWCPGKDYPGWKEAEHRAVMNLPSHESRQPHHVILLKYLPAPSQSLFRLQFPLFLPMLFLSLPIHSTYLLRAICSRARLVTQLILLFCALAAWLGIMRREH